MSNKKSHINLGRFAFPVASVPFAGAYYMCVAGSKRHDALNRANHAFNMGYRELAEDLKQEALEQPGCAFDLRENADADTTAPSFDSWAETKLRDKKNN